MGDPSTPLEITIREGGAGNYDVLTFHDFSSKRVAGWRIVSAGSSVHVLERDLPDFSEIRQEPDPPLPRIFVLNRRFPSIEHHLQLPVVLLHKGLPKIRQNLVDLFPVLVSGTVEVHVGVLSEEGDGPEVLRINCG